MVSLYFLTYCQSANREQEIIMMSCDHTRAWRRTVTGVTPWLRPLWPRQCEPHLRLRLRESPRSDSGMRTLASPHLVTGAGLKFILCSPSLKRMFSSLIPSQNRFRLCLKWQLCECFDHINNKRIVLVQSFLANLNSKTKEPLNLVWVDLLTSLFNKNAVNFSVFVMNIRIQMVLFSNVIDCVASNNF